MTFKEIGRRHIEATLEPDYQKRAVLLLELIFSLVYAIALHQKGIINID